MGLHTHLPGEGTRLRAAPPWLLGGLPSRLILSLMILGILMLEEKSQMEGNVKMN